MIDNIFRAASRRPSDAPKWAITALTVARFPMLLVVLSVMLIAGCSGSNEPLAPTTGTLEIRVSTDSANVAVDPGDYTLIIDGGSGQPVGANATLTIAGLARGLHRVRLDGVATNYMINGVNPRWVDVTTDIAPPLTVSFSVTRVLPGDCAGCWDY